MTLENTLPFEFPFRWKEMRDHGVEVPDRAEEFLEERDRSLEDHLVGVGETIIFHQTGGGVVVEESDDCPVRRGGSPTVVAQLKVAPTAAVTITLYRNGGSIGTLTIGVGETQVQQSFGVAFTPLDRVRTAVTNGGAGAKGLVVVWWF